MTVRFDLELHLWPVGDEIQGFCAYNRDLFEAETISTDAFSLSTLAGCSGRESLTTHQPTAADERYRTAAVTSGMEQHQNRLPC